MHPPRNRETLPNWGRPSYRAFLADHLELDGEESLRLVGLDTEEGREGIVYGPGFPVVGIVFVPTELLSTARRQRSRRMYARGQCCLVGVICPPGETGVIVGSHQRLRGRPAPIAARIRAVISDMCSPRSWPARIAAPIARERPAGPRTSARGLPGSRRRASHSARFSAAVPIRRCDGCWQEWLSHVWQTVGLSVPQPSRGITPCAS